MSDLLCAKCGEPWDAHGIPRVPEDSPGDMKWSEAERFRKGEGCPCCHFGEVCPTCSGTGKDSDYHPSNCCPNGLVLAWVPNHSGFQYQAGHFYNGYYPNVQEVKDPEKVRHLGGHMSRDGWVSEWLVKCPTCKGDGEHLFPCGRCDGSGKLEPDPDLELKAAEAELAWSDEEPIGILIRRGLM